MTLRPHLTTLGDGLPAAIARIDAAEFADADHAEQIVDWLGHLRISRGCSSLTLVRYADVLREYIAWLDTESILPDDMRAELFDRWQRHLYIERRLQEKSRAGALSAVRGWYSWRVTTGRGSANPAADIPGPKVPLRVPRKYSTAELRRMFTAALQGPKTGVRDHALLAVAYATGARRRELTGMNLGDLLVRQRVVTVRFHGKGAKEREVSFQGAAVEALRNWLLARDQYDGYLAEPDAVWVHVYRNQYAGQRMVPQSIDRMMARIAQRAGIEHGGIHQVRSTFATDLFDQGEPIEVIQQLMGHNRLETTRRYIVISEKYRRTRMATARLDEVIRGNESASAPLWARQKLKEGQGIG